jgi:hypothetical protein
MLRSAVEVVRAHRGDIEKLGLGAEIESKLMGALELLEGALSRSQRNPAMQSHLPNHVSYEPQPSS